MSIKTKLKTAKNKVATFIKENKQDAINHATLGALIGVTVLLTAHERRLNQHALTINKNADLMDWNARHPYYLEKTGEKTFMANRVTLDDPQLNP